MYLYRAIDQHGQVIDVLVSQKRDLQQPVGFSCAHFSKAHDRAR